MPTPLAHATMGYVIYRIYQLRVPQPGDLGKHEPEMARSPALDGPSLALVQVGECDFEMGANSLPAARQKSECGSTEGLSDRSGERQRESPANADEAPEAGVEHEASGAGRHGKSVTE